jgi:hypothetical protein
MKKVDYIQHVNNRLGVRFDAIENYKFCELKPMRGFLFEEEIQGYDFFGYGDIDLIYGNIRKFCTDSILEKINVYSTHTWCISGHFALIRNEKCFRNAFKRIRKWKEIIEHSDYQRFDEDLFIQAFKYPEYLSKFRLGRFVYDIFHFSSRKYRNNLVLFEHFTTPLTPIRWLDGTFNHPKVWFWKDGRVTNNINGDVEFIYFHFMNYKHARFMDTKYGENAFWEGLDNIIHVKSEDIWKGVKIDEHGFHQID